MTIDLNFNKSVSMVAGALLLSVLAVNAQAQTSWSSNPQPDVQQATQDAAGKVYKTQSEPEHCRDCGRVTAVTVAEKSGDSNAVGLIAGGVAGAVLGHQVGGGLGKDLATIAGAVGGAYAGKKIQENMNTQKVWTVSVKYHNGNSANFDFTQDPGLAVGDVVKNSGNTVVRY
jgi:outer membrane lipoprotein SlyB